MVRRLLDKSSKKIGREVYQEWIHTVLRKHDWKRKYAGIYSRSQPGASHLIGLMVKSNLNLPWLAGFSDPWAYNPYHMGTARMQKDEAAVVRQADKMVFPTVEMVELMARHYPAVDWDKKAVVIPHCFEGDLYPNAPQDTAADPFIDLAYVGDFYGLRSPKSLLAALTKLADLAPDLAGRIRLLLAGNVESKFQPDLQEFQMSFPGELQISGQVPYLQSLALMKKADVLILVDAPGAANLFLPSKLIDYFGALKPILGITPTIGTTARLLKQFGHATAGPEEIDAIELEMRKLLQNLEEAQVRAAQLQYEEFTAVKVAQTIRDLFEQMI
jgi:hypothetical protein